MATGYGSAPRAIHTLASGETLNLKGMACKYTEMETDMKGNGKGVLSMVKGVNFFLMEMFT